jgi:hypothetical protein
MSLLRCYATLSLALAAFCSLPPAARAAGGVVDGANLFGRSARIRADDIIEDVRHRTHRDVLIETVRKLPQAKITEYQSLKTDSERASFLRTLATERAEAAGFNGVYVLLCRVTTTEEARHGLHRFLPRSLAESLAPHVFGHAVVVWPESNDDSFPEDARRHVDSVFTSERNSDNALLQAADFTRSELVANTRGAPPLDTFIWTDVLWAALILVAVWVALGVLRVRVAARQGTPGPVPGANQAFAALFGAAGGLWLLEAYRARRHESVNPAPTPEPAAAASDVGGAMHPDDLDAIARGSALWHDAEATTGHDLL